MNLRDKICMHMGSLLLASIEADDQLEQALANTSAKDAKIAELRAAVDAAAKVVSDAAAAQTAHDASVDARDAPSGAPAPMEIPPANVETVPAGAASDGVQPA